MLAATWPGFIGRVVAQFDAVLTTNVLAVSVNPSAIPRDAVGVAIVVRNEGGDGDVYADLVQGDNAAVVAKGPFIALANSGEGSSFAVPFARGAGTAGPILWVAAGDGGATVAVRIIALMPVNDNINTL